MKTLCFFLVLHFLLYCTPNGEAQTQQVQDLSGWDKTKWGMAQEEVKNLYADRIIPAQEKDPEDTFVPFIIEDVNSDGINFKARFIFNKNTSRLQAVTLQAPRAETDEDLFERLHKVLVSKYGDPLSNIKSEPAGLKTIKQMWAIDKTRIDLIFLIDKNKQVRALFIKYSDRSIQ